MRKSVAFLLAVIVLCGLLIGARTALNNAVLTSDMDAAGHKIINMPSDQPLPPPVMPSAIPSTWLGTTDTTAAKGSLAEFKSNKGQNNGYAALDSGGKVPSAQIPAGVGLGSVTSVGVTTANGVSASGGPITSSGSFSFSLGDITPTSVSVAGTAGAGFIALASQGVSTPAGSRTIWADNFGRLNYKDSTSGFTLTFGTTAFTASRLATYPDKNGVIAYTDDIPSDFLGVGPGHKNGTVPDPGSSGTGTDYLARDGNWKPIPTAAGPTYQPQVPAVTISPSTNTTGARNITLGSSLAGATLFYDVGSSSGPFVAYPGTAVSLPAGSTIYSYAAKAGYTNSAIANYTNPNP